MERAESRKSGRFCGLLSSANGAFLVGLAAHAEVQRVSVPAAAESDEGRAPWRVRLTDADESLATAFGLVGTYGAFASQSQPAVSSTESMDLGALTDNQVETTTGSLLAGHWLVSTSESADRFRSGNRPAPRARGWWPGAVASWRGTHATPTSGSGTGSGFTALFDVSNTTIRAATAVYAWVAVVELKPQDAVGSASYAAAAAGGMGVGANGTDASGAGAGTPEPAAGGLALLALGAAGLMRHRRRSAASTTSAQRA